MGQRFAVRTVAHMIHDHEGHPSTTLLGQTDRDAQEIILSTSVGDDKAREVYIHEVLHTMTGLTGLTTNLSFAEEEDLVNRMAPVLLQFLRDNPTVYTYLTGRYVGGKGSAV